MFANSFTQEPPTYPPDVKNPCWLQKTESGVNPYNDNPFMDSMWPRVRSIGLHNRIAEISKDWYERREETVK